MRIAFVFREIKKSSNTAYIPVILNYFIERGHEVEVFAQSCGFDLEYEKLPSFGKNIILKEISVSIGSLLKIKRSKFDLIYSRAGTRYLLADICSLHFLFSEYSGASLSSYMFKFGEKLSFMLKNKYIIAVSNLLKNAIIRKYSIDKSKIKVIHNGVNTEVFNSRNRKSRKTKDIREKYLNGFEKLAVFVGARPYRKGLPHLLESMKETEGCKLIVIGIENELEAKFKILSKKLGIEDKIEFVGLLPHSELRYFYAAADIFVLPTFFDPCAVSTLEAMASGCVPVDSVFNGSSELIENWVNGFKVKNPRNTKEIANYINLLIEDKNLFKKLQKNAIKTGEGRSLYVVAKEWEEYFREVYERLGRGTGRT